MITVKIDDREYSLSSADEALSTLTGTESLMVEDYLGGFDQFGVHATKTAIVTVWLALRAAGDSKTLEEIQEMPGLLFGGMIHDDGIGEPVDPMEDPGRPLVEKNGANGSNDGTAGSAATQATSGSSGGQA